MSPTSQHLPPADDDGAPRLTRERPQRARLILLIAAVVLAAVGLLALGAVLVSAWQGIDPWPGFVTAAYFFLPLGFFFMILNVVVSILLRGRN